MIRIAVLAAGILLVAEQGIACADDMTVQSLLDDGYKMTGAIFSSGAGIFLQKSTKLYFCFVAEKPGSPTVATQYCKPVK